MLGYGDGPTGRSLRPPPADLTARHAADHTVGDLFWWISRGIPASAMPGFADRLSAEQRWDLVNFLRTLAAAEVLRTLGPVVAPRPAALAPDFTFTTGVVASETERTLRELRGQRVVLLVLFSLPESRERLETLARVHADLRARGAEILGLPVGDGVGLSGGAVYRALGPSPIFFPIAAGGAEDATEVYSLFGGEPGPAVDTGGARRLRHLEVLVDRQSYLRARWIPGQGPGWQDPAVLVGEIDRLVREPARVPPPGDHVH
jgi:putative copper resistance protein D